MTKKILATFLITCISSSAYAGTGFGGSVVSLVPNVGGAFTFAYSGTHNSSPSCGLVTMANWAIDVSSPSGQAAAAAVTTAFALGLKVNIMGTGTCPASEPDEESVRYVEILR